MTFRTYRQELRPELLRRAERDQQARRGLGDPPTAEQWEVVKAVDDANVPWLEHIIAEHGWPGADLVGEDGAHAAWLLAQHVPLHLQQRWLPLLQEAVVTGDATAVDLAYLDDRVRIREKRTQLHGTQWLVGGDQQRLYPIEDSEQVNQRRAALHLPQLTDEDVANAWPAETAFGTLEPDPQ